MTFTVVWSANATLDFARILAGSTDPAGVREAANRVDYWLRRTPRDLGESRGRGFRIWYHDVLVVFYRIDEAAQRVEVLFAGPARRH